MLVRTGSDVVVIRFQICIFDILNTASIGKNTLGGGL